MPGGQSQLIVDPAKNHISTGGFRCDGSGNLIQDLEGSYTFDAENRMTSGDRIWNVTLDP